MLVVFSAFVLFFLVYGLFAVYHMIKFNYKGDLAAPSVTLFVLVSAAIIAATYVNLLR